MAAVLAIYASGLQPFRFLPVYASAGPPAVAAAAATAAVQHLTTTSVNCTPTVIAPGESTVCTATVSDTDLVTPTTPTSTVNFTSNGAGTFSSSSCTLSGSGNSASCSVSYTSTGLGGSVITATYGGDATHAASSGSTLVADPPKRTTSTNVSCTPGSVVVGQSTTCTAAVTDTDTPPTTTPTGAVSFMKSGGSGTFTPTSCTLIGTGGSASCSVTYTPDSVGSGTHTITPSYGGDTTHYGSSGSTTVTVSARSTSTSVSCTPATVPVAASTNCTAT